MADKSIKNIMQENHLQMYQFYNMDCIEGCKQYIKDNSVDLIITDPPYGIHGDKLHKHYNRKEEFVIDGYIEVPAEEYADFSNRWISQAERILRPGGSIYIVSGYTHLIDILVALHNTSLVEVNHLIWKYNFGVYTKRKYISSHYHLLYYIKPGGKPIFNTFSRFDTNEKNDTNGSSNYSDREDVWIINREYKPGQKKNKNQLPSQLLIKILQYSSNEGDLVCDLFLGSFSTAKIALGMNRRVVGFEKSGSAFEYQIKEMEKIETGHLLKNLRVPEFSVPGNQGKPWTKSDKENIASRYDNLMNLSMNKKNIIEVLCKEFGRGRFSISKLLDNLEREGFVCRREKRESQLDLF